MAADLITHNKVEFTEDGNRAITHKLFRQGTEELCTIYCLVELPITHS